MIGFLDLGIWVALATGVWGAPFTPYDGTRFDGFGAPDAPGTGTKLALKRSVVQSDVHLEIARVQAVNRAFKKFAKRLDSPVKRDAYGEVLAKHNELVKRGETPGSSHLLSKRHKGESSNSVSSESRTEVTTPTSILLADTPAVTPAVPLDQDGQDITYFSPIKLGSQGKQFLVVMDTGSSDLWVPAANCQSEACKVHETFGSADSSTLQATTTPWQIQYGTGSAAGVLVADTFSIGGLSVQRMPFGVATQLSSNFAQFTPDGILGLALTQANAQGVATVMDQLAANNLISKKLIGVNLDRASDNNPDGEISFGIVDTSKFSGNLAIVPNVNLQGLWEVPIDDASVNGQALGFVNRTSITDTGTTLLIIPPDDATTIHNAIPGSVTDGQGNFAFPCTTNANLAVSFAGKSFSISPKDYVGAQLSGSTSLCQSNIVGQQVGGPTQWLMGDVFLKNVYSVFDYTNNQIGFGAKTATGGSTNSIVAQSLVADSGAGSLLHGSGKILMYGLGSVMLSIILLF